MKIIKQWTLLALVICSLVLFGINKPGIAATANLSVPDKMEAPSSQTINVGYIEGISFEKPLGKERIIISVSKQPILKIETQADNSLLINMEDMFIPDSLRRPLGEGQLNNITQVTSSQKTVGGKQWVVIKTGLKQRVPYSVRQEGGKIFLDFNITTLSADAETAIERSKPVQQGVSDSTAIEGGIPGKNSKADTARTISLDFQDASIKSVLRLLAETGGVSIVSGDDVRGNVTVNLKKIPWEQAFNTILELNGLTKKQVGDVIIVMTLDKLKKDEDNRKASEEARRKAEEDQMKAEQTRLAEKGKLRQILIEAKIVETTEDFTRNLGVQWGAGTIGTWGKTPYGILGGTNPIIGSAVASLPNNIGITSSNLAINFPSAITSGTPGLGVIIGGTKAVLDAQISALESTSQGKIISSPTVRTLDNVKAIIRQGEEVPYQSVDKNGNPSTDFKRAELLLEVTPRIIQDNKIHVQIKATNDRVNYARVAELGGKVPIFTSQVDSTIVVEDGGTIIIGGVLKTDDSTGDTGIPWLSRIPVLGWLFKTQSVIKSKRHLLIIVTPKIIRDDIQEEKAKA